MCPTSPPGLDADELLHLALAATDQDRPDDALAYLKQGLELAPDDGRLHYLLGAIHAELKMYDRACEEMARAAELTPGLTTAHFQLGLLHLTAGNIAAAEAAWQALDALDKEAPLSLFKSGLLHLVRDEFRPCIDLLRAGIARNTLNEPLNDDMRRVITEAEKALMALDSAPGESAPATGKRAFLSAYGDEEEEDAKH